MGWFSIVSLIIQALPQLWNLFSSIDSNINDGTHPAGTTAPQVVAQIHANYQNSVTKTA